MNQSPTAFKSTRLTAEGSSLDFERETAELQDLYESIADPVRRRQAVDLLRALAPADRVVPRAAPRPGRDRSDAQQYRILLVDDDSDVLVSIGGFLEAEGIEVARAINGTDAMAILMADNHIDGVVTDFAMPGMSGAEFIRAARRLRPALPAVVITGYAGIEAFGALPPDVAVLRKPFRRSAFVAAVYGILKHDAFLRSLAVGGDAHHTNPHRN